MGELEGRRQSGEGKCCSHAERDRCWNNSSVAQHTRISDKLVEGCQGSQQTDASIQHTYTKTTT
jgi:hypothetical protein